MMPRFYGYSSITSKPEFPKCNIYLAYSFSIDGVRIHADGETGYRVDVATLNLAMPQTLEVLKQLQAHREHIDAYFNITTLVTFLRDYINGEQSLLEYSPDYSDIVIGLATRSGLATVRRWMRLTVKQDWLTFGFDLAIIPEHVKEIAADLAKYDQWRNDRYRAEQYKKRHDGFVYLFRLSTGHYKIGLSIHPEKRGKEIISSLPLEIELLHTIPSNQISKLEDELHHQYREKRLGKTEWFNLNEDDVAAIKAISKRDFYWVDNSEYWEWLAEYEAAKVRRKEEQYAKALAEHNAQASPDEQAS